MSERSEREIRESIESTRGRMGDTIEQIGDRVNPGRATADLKSRAREQANDAKDNVKRKARDTMRDVEHGVGDTGRGIWTTIRENPIPAGMVGVGVAWLIANRRSADEHRRYEYGSRTEDGPTTGYGSTSAYDATGGLDRASEDGVDARSTGFAAGAGSSQWNDETGREQSGGVREKASNAVHQAGDRLENVQERVGGAMHGAQERVGGAMHGAQERVGGAMHGAQDRVSSAAHQGKDRARRAEHRVEDALRENPIAAGAAALAIGMAAGLTIPETDREHRMLGRARERAMDRAGDAVHRSTERLHDAARNAAGETARHAVDEVWPGGDGDQTEGFSEPRR